MAKIEYRNGSWTTRVSLTDPATGKRRQERITGRTKTEVRDQIADLITKHRRGIAVDPSKITVAEWVADWIAHREAKPATRVHNQITLDKHIRPDPIGPMKLQHVKPLHVQQWIDRLSERLEPTTVRTLYATLRAAVARADALDVIERTPCRGIQLPKVTTSERAVLSEDDVRRLIEEATGDSYSAAWVLMSVIGLRIGEVLGLRWGDVDFERRTLRVERTMSRFNKNTWIIGESPKTESSRRIITLPDVCLSALRTHRTHQLERRLKTGEMWIDGGAVFDNGVGEHYASPNTFGRKWRAIRQRLDFPNDITVHGLRHTAASLAIKNGVPITTIAKMLGHANPSITLKVYAHVFTRMEEEAAAILDSVYASQSKSSERLLSG